LTSALKGGEKLGPKREGVRGGLENRFAVLLRHYWGDEIKKEETGNTRCKHGRQKKCRVGNPKRKEAAWTI